MNNKESFLIKNGKSIDTIKFCKELNVGLKDLVWFVERIEKEFDKDKLECKIFRDSIEKCVNYFEKISPKNKSLLKKVSLKNVIIESERNIENKESVQSRILHTFKDGSFIINLTYKELGFESIEMRNCLADYKSVVKSGKVCILALKDKKSKTICHLEINKNGRVVQALERFNKNLKYKTFDYIQEFFKIYEDKKIYNKIKKLGFGTLYDLNFAKTVNGLPIVESFFPTRLSKSLLEEEGEMNIDLNSCKKINNYNYSIMDLDNLSKGSLKDVIKSLEDYKNYIDKNIQTIINTIKSSYDNYFILNDEIIEKIYNKKPKTTESKLKSILEEDKIFNDRLFELPEPHFEINVNENFVDDDIFFNEDLSLENCNPGIDGIFSPDDRSVFADIPTEVVDLAIGNKAVN